MITDRDIDRQLVSWFEDWATSTAPEGLLERSLDRVGDTRQRPGWLVPERWGPRDARSFPAGAPARLGLALVAVLTLAIVATMVGGLLRHEPALIVEPSLSPSPSLAVSPEPSVSAAPPSPSRRPPPPPVTGLPPRAGMFSDLTDYLPASDTVGWVSTPAGLYRTADAGRTWTEVRPQGWTSAAATALVDTGTAYIASGGSPVTIAATHDGGATWTDASLDVGAISGGPVFSFETPMTGFASFYDMNGTTALDVYATTDGSATWTGPKRGKVPHMTASMDKLYPPSGGFLLQSGGKADTKPFDNQFFLSADGGVTWSRYTYPVGALAPKDAPKGIGGIVQEDNGHILIVIGADGGRNPIPAGVYESGDGPTSWRLVTELPESLEPHFLSPTDWVLFSSPLSQVRTTTDGGNHWTTTKSSMSLYDMFDHRFATVNTGWGIVECEYVKGAACPMRHAKVLFITTDGGATWTRIGG